MASTAIVMITCTGLGTAQDDRRLPEIPVESILATYVDAPVFDDLLNRLDLDESAREVALERHAQYEDAVRTLHADVQRRIFELFTEEELNDETPRTAESMGERRVLAMMRAVQRIVRSTQADNRELLMTLRSGMHDIVGDDQQASVDRAWLDMMRTLHLRPRNPGGPPHDMKRHVDLIAHWSDATSPDGSLARLHADAIASVDDEDDRAKLQQVATAVRDRLDAYAGEINAVLEEADYRAAMMRIHMQISEAKLLGRENTLRDLADQQRSLWMRIYEPTEQHARAIARTIEPAVGESAARAWLDAFYRAVFPELMGPVSSELLYDWAIKRDDLTEQQRDAIEHLYHLYLAEREHWRERARNVRLRTMAGLVTQPATLGTYVPEDLRPIEQTRSEFAARFNDALRDMLTDEQVNAFEKERTRIKRYAEVGVELRY